MENNQEHKIDKIFKQSLDNQSVKPPSDAWMSIHTYTIGQEESKRKVWFRYASLSIVLLILGLGLWYIGDKQKVVNDKLIVKNTSNRLASELLLKNTKNERNSILKTPKTALENAGRVLNPDSVRTPNQIVYLDNQSGGLQISRVKSVIQSPKPLKHEKFASLKTIEKQPLIIEIVEDSSINYNTQFEGTVSNFNDNNIHEIKSKPLILNDLVNKMQTEKESRIVLINRVSKRNIIESDTIIEHKKKLSLRNPIITFAGGNSWNYWNIQRNIPVFSGAGITNLNNSGITIKVGIAWKINNKLRFGMSLIHNNIKLTDGSNFYNFKNNETEEFLKIKKDKNLLNQFYASLSPFGGNINVDSTSLFNYDPVIIASSALQFTIYHVPNSMRTISVSFNSNYSIFDRIRKNKNNFKYELYLLSELSFQRQIKFYYTKRQFMNTPTFFYGEGGLLNIYEETNHPENTSELVFGLRAGLGFRYQFAQKWDFFIEGSGQHSLNNWVKSDDIKTFQRTLSLQAGINLNL